ncbi:MAG: YkgJ family cysteine cluster protein [Deltaproteobacteria bacterium]|nr:YkgJ family cysteine cluster protein [Deltaproteobacteria bacterium]MBW1928199.1 YkgJ family cysteine cluster protein [Deltaproteobacteria bacterium]MBW2024354.1 YkgJ family cysteine cluster protein [Deltaproteobacteria bacterium]MBW2124651.1 YkgJ family cysteine cluster protein [Deltaproteobacteria bacterium]RLB15243.1 MAG: hypothetical protein DRG63_07215 [Deltaproteobacteria bacterium]
MNQEFSIRLPTGKLFELYEDLVNRADKAFERIARDYPEEMGCRLGCSECCYALFGLFFIEAVYIRRHFEGLDDVQRQEALLRGQDTEHSILRLQDKLRGLKDDTEQIARQVGKERIKCPLLDDNDKCILYPWRPITCRVYGIPTIVRGKARVCSRSAFGSGKYYPTFDLDKTNKELYLLSKAMLMKINGANPDKASLLISMPKVIKTPVEGLISECFG